MLRAFDSEQWLLDFHESLAYLQQMDRVERIDGKYTLTQQGRERIEEINDRIPGSNVDYEAQQILRMAKRVRVGLGL